MRAAMPSTDPALCAQHVSIAGVGVDAVAQPVAAVEFERRVQAEVERRWASEARCRKLVEAITDCAVYTLDAGGHVSSWNPGALRLKGYAEAEVLGRHFSLFYPGDDARAGAPQRALDAARRDGRFETEGWRMRKDGSRFWAHVIIDSIRSDAGELIGFAKVTRDLSERRLARKALSRSKEQFRLLVQAVTDYAIYMLDTNGTVTSWNAGARRIKGYTADEVLGTHFSRFYREEDRLRGDPEAVLATAMREGRCESEGWRVRKDGSQFWANVVVDPIYDDDGSMIGFAKVTRDVTEKRHAQQALEQAREALFQSQKLDAIGQLTGGIAHDFNNLLMVVISSLELLRRRLPEDPKLRQLIENAMTGAKRGASLTQRMLAFARRQDLVPIAVDVRQLVRGMRELLGRTLGQSIRIDVDLTPDLKRVLVDPNQLELAVLNLAVNARDAMPDGGTLTIAADTRTLATPQGKMRAGSYLCLSITDTGVGMDESTLSHATEPFFTTKGIGKGTGLGLPMVHGLAAQSGGQFLLHSTPGNGTTAELWLPFAGDEAGISTDPATGPDPVVRPAEEASVERVVLVVDDDALVLMNTAAMLEELGHVVLQASSAAMALDIVRSGRHIDVLITDHSMPDMSGAQLIALLGRERPGVASILATGFTETGTGATPGMRKLNKPFDQDTLARTIRQALAMRSSAGASAAGSR
jgi:PAS domain S-box-containing protein